MQYCSQHEEYEKQRFDEHLRQKFQDQSEEYEEQQGRTLELFKGKLERSRLGQLAQFRKKEAIFKRNRKNRLARLRDVQLSEFQKLCSIFQAHSVRMRMLSERRTAGCQSTSLKPVHPAVFGYALIVLKREMHPQDVPRNIIRDGQEISGLRTRENVLR
jgi:hypothetical protein